MKKVMFKSSKLMIVVLAISALIFTGCSCGSKDKKDEKSTQKGVAATIINEDGSVEYVDDIIKKDKSDNNSNVNGSSDEEDVNDLVGSSDGKKSNSKKSNSSKSSYSKSNAKKSDGTKSDNKSSDSGKKSDSKKSDSKKKDSGKKDSDKKSDDKKDDEKTTKKSNFDIEKSDNDNRFGPIINGKKKK